MRPDPKRTTTPRLLDDIRNQPRSLERLLNYHTGEGRPAIVRAAAAVRQSRHIVLTGMGSSLFASVPLQYLLASHGYYCQVVEAAELAHYLAVGAAGAAVIMTSRSGETVEIRRALKAVADRASVTVGVSNELGSRLLTDTQFPIYVNSLADEMVAVQTYSGTVATLLLLGWEIVQEPEAEWRRSMDALTAALASAIARYEVESTSWWEFLEPAASMYLLARGPSTGSALEGALLFNEVAKTSSTAMGAGEFRHGPVEIVNSKFRGIVFAPESRTRDLNLALVHDIDSFGGAVRVIGPESGSDPKLIWPVAALPDMVAPLAEIVPVQFAALRLAECRGIVPGQFSYVSQVTVSELSFDGPQTLARSERD